MKRPRMTCRTLMIGIALAALATWGRILWRRSAEFAAKAEQHSSILMGAKLNWPRDWYSSHGLPRPPGWRWTASEEADMAYYDRIIRYEDEMIRKYRRLASFPWLPVAPDHEGPPGSERIE